MAENRKALWSKAMLALIMSAGAMLILTAGQYAMAINENTCSTWQGAFNISSNTTNGIYTFNSEGISGSQQYQALKKQCAYYQATSLPELLTLQIIGIWAMVYMWVDFIIAVIRGKGKGKNDGVGTNQAIQVQGI